MCRHPLLAAALTALVPLAAGCGDDERDDEAIELLYEVTCGEQTILDDGIVRR